MLGIQLEFFAPVDRDLRFKQTEACRSYTYIPTPSLSLSLFLYRYTYLYIYIYMNTHTLNPISHVEIVR